MNTTTLKGNWNIAKGKLKQKFSNLTDNDLTYTNGKEEELLGRLQKKTGQTRDQLEKFLKHDCDCVLVTTPRDRAELEGDEPGLDEVEQAQRREDL